MARIRTQQSLTLLLTAPWRRWYVFFPVLIAVPCTYFAWRAVATTQPYAAESLWRWALCMLVAIAVGTSLAWAFEASDSRLLRTADVTRALQWQVLAELPYDRWARPLSGDTGHLTALSHESYERIAAHITFMRDAYELRSFCVTSTRDGEGKTTAASRLAVTLSLKGYRVILVDTHLDAPAIHERFSLANEYGLSDLLDAIDIDDGAPGAAFAGSEEILARALASTELAKLRVISAGRNPCVAPKYSSREHFLPFVHQLRRMADFVICDSAAVNSESTALSCTASVDGCLFVVEARKSARAAALEAKQRLIKDRANVLGVLFNHTEKPVFWSIASRRHRRPASVHRPPTNLRKGVNQT